MAAPSCRHMTHDGFETTCRLTGASVAEDCGNPRAPGMGDAPDCIPRMALRYMTPGGDRAWFAALGKNERQAVMSTAQVIVRRSEQNKLHLRDVKRAERTEPRTMADEQVVTDLTKMSPKQLRELADRARKAAVQKERSQKQAARVLPALRGEKETLEARLEAIETAIELVEAGGALTSRRWG